MAPRVITLTGPSTSGKSTVVGMLRRLKSKRFKPRIIPKFTTRAPRADDGEEIICVKSIPPSCDLVYEQYGVRYGLKKRTILERLAAAESPIIIINDIRTVEDIRSFFGPLAISLYIFRESPSIEKYLAMARERQADEEQYQQRFRKAQAIHRIFIENIQNFDYVLLNIGDRDLLQRQVEGIVEAIRSERRRLREVST